MNFQLIYMTSFLSFKNHLITKRPKSVTTSLLLILLNAAFWLGYAIITFLTNHDAATVSYVARWIFSFLALGVAAVLAILFFLPRKRIRLHIPSACSY